MTDFYIDCDELSEGDRNSLQTALSDLADSDMPLLVELLFVSEEEIRVLNARERGVDRVTDVLSFPAMELRPGEKILADEHGECVEENVLVLGSVVVCTQRAREQAAEYGHSEAREIGYLTVHGVLHCLGYDHMEEEEKRAMRKKEEEIMEKLNLGRGE